MTERERERERESKGLDGTSLKLIIHSKVNFSKDIKILREREKAKLNLGI